MNDTVAEPTASLPQAAAPAAPAPSYRDFLDRVTSPKAIDPAWLPVRLTTFEAFAATLGEGTTGEVLVHPDDTGRLPLFAFRDASLYRFGGFHQGRTAVEEFLLGAQMLWESLGVGHFLASVMPFEHFDAASRTFFLAQPAEATVVTQPTYWFGSPYAAVNFGHFVHDVLLQLVLVDRLKERLGPGLRYVLPGFHARQLRYPMQRVLFEALIGPLDRLSFQTAELALMRELYAGCPTFCMNHRVDFVSADAAAYLSRRVRETFAADITSGGAERIYITRDDGTIARTIDNEPFVRATLVRHGFVPVTIGTLGPAETIALFGSAKVIFGLHGAGLLNMIFADPATLTVFEIDTVPAHSPAIIRFGRAMGATMVRINCRTSAQPGSLGVVDEAAFTSLVAGLG